MMLTRQHRLSNIARVANRSSVRGTFQSSQYNRSICPTPRNISYRTISYSATFIPHGPYNSKSSSIGFITQTDEESRLRTLACSIQINHLKESFLRKIIRKLLELAVLLKDSILITARSSAIAIRLTPLIILTPAAILSSSRQNEKSAKTSIIADTSWWYFRHTVQKLGPAFVKMAQWASTRRDLFPANVCNRLSELHDSNILHSWNYTQKVLKQIFGDDMNGLQIRKNDVIGSGSVAQVYRGIICDLATNTQKSVAIKILHPNIKERMECDILLMKRIANVLGTFDRRYSIFFHHFISQPC